MTLPDSLDIRRTARALYGDVFVRRLRAMNIRDRPTAARSPWQNGYDERLIGSIRRECMDNVVVFSERHLFHLLEARTHLSLNKDHPLRAQLWAASLPNLSSEDCIINTSGFDFR